MTKHFKISRIFSLLLALAVIFTFSFAVSAKTAPKKVALVTLTQKDDLTVMFDFEVQNVDITFISPSGDTFTKDSDGVEFAEGDLWATYKIHDAIPGPWKVSYDLGDNTYINYSIVESQEGIFVQSFEILSLEENILSVSFSAEVGDLDVYYDYEIGVIDSESKSQILTDGSAMTKETIEKEISLRYVNSGEYTPFINVYYVDEIEVFDSIEGDSFNYSNPDAPEAMSDFIAYIDTHSAFATLNWENYDSYSMDSYKVMAYSGDELFTVMNTAESKTTIAFPKDATTLKFEIYYFDGSLISKPCTKTIDLVNGEYVKLITGEATGQAGAELEVKVSEDRYMLIFVNENPDERTLSNMRADLENSGEVVKSSDKTLYIPFDKGGNNTLYLELFVGDNVVFTIDKIIYYDMYPPSITLYESLNGKTFADQNVSILGKVSDCKELFINGKAVELEADGSFSYSVSLSGGKNDVTIEAFDQNRNGAVMTLSLYRPTAAQNISEITKKLTGQYLPLLISAIVGAVAFVVFLIAMRGKKEKQSKKPLARRILTAVRVISFIAFAVSTFEFIRRTVFIHSIKYLDLAEKSMQKAADYISARNISFIVMIVSIIAFILLLVLPKKQPKPEKKKKEKKSKKDKNKE